MNQGATLMNIVQQQGMQIQQLQAMLGMMPEQAAGSSAPSLAAENPKSEEEIEGAGRNKVASGVMEARKPMTSYGNRLAKRSSANMDVADEMNPLKR